MYLLIHEDGSMQTASKITDDDKAACDEGILDVVRTVGYGNSMAYEQYYKGEWHVVVESGQ